MTLVGNCAATHHNKCSACLLNNLWKPRLTSGDKEKYDPGAKQKLKKDTEKIV